MATDIQLILTTCPDYECASVIAEQLIDAQLSACVNILPGITSIYQWKNEIQSEQEHLLIAKTSANLYQQVEQCILAQHPYELPEIIAIPLENGLADYLNWVHSCLC